MRQPVIQDPELKELIQARKSSPDNKEVKQKLDQHVDRKYGIDISGKSGPGFEPDKHTYQFLLNQINWENVW